MRRLRQERGAALVATLILAAVLLPVGAWMSLQARIDGVLTRSLRADVHAFYVADAGLNHALAAVAEVTSAAAALDGSMLVLPQGHVPFPGPPFGYRIEILPHGTDGVRLRSSGSGFDGTVKQLEAVVVWRDGRARAWWREAL